MHIHPGKGSYAVLAALLIWPVTPTFAQVDAADLTVDPAIIPQELVDKAVALRERALLDNLSVDIVESVTTEVGPRRIGTDGDKRVIAWSQAKFRELGFDKVWTEEVELDRGWTRGQATAAIIAPFPHNIVMTALGYSVGTNGDLVGEVVEFPTLADLDGQSGKLIVDGPGKPRGQAVTDRDERGEATEFSRFKSYRVVGICGDHIVHIGA